MEHLVTWVMGAGLVGIAAWSFLAATLVPLSSELVVLAAAATGSNAWAVWGAASVGNAAGAATSYALGRWLSPRAERRLRTSASGRRALELARTRGWPTLALSWLPVLGDPLLVAAGVVRIPVVLVCVFGLGARVARYGVILWPWLA